MQDYEGRTVSGRLVAKVNFLQLNHENDEINLRTYHFSSYKSEEIVDAEKFFSEHLIKIGSRLDNFNCEGSNLLLKNISHIHVVLSLRKSLCNVKTFTSQDPPCLDAEIHYEGNLNQSEVKRIKGIENAQAFERVKSH